MNKEIYRGSLVFFALLIASVIGLGAQGLLIGHIDFTTYYSTETNEWISEFRHGEFDNPDARTPTDEVSLPARDFAIEHGFEKCKTPIKEVKKDWKEWKKENKELLKKPRINHENHDTIGMLALDEFGNISGSCTTSGWAYKMHGRVGDSPIIGAGLFVDNEVGGSCATGMGEAIIRIAGSHTVVELMRQGKSPQDACRLAVERIISKHADVTGLQCGFIAMDVNGRVGSYSVYSGFNYALQMEYGKNVMVDSEYMMEW